MRYNHRAIGRLRKERGFELLELAERAKLKRQTVSWLERGVTKPRADTLAKLADALGVGVEVFFEQTA